MKLILTCLAIALLHLNGVNTETDVIIVQYLNTNITGQNTYPPPLAWPMSNHIRPVHKYDMYTGNNLPYYIQYGNNIALLIKYSDGQNKKQSKKYTYKHKYSSKPKKTPKSYPSGKHFAY